MGNLLPGLVLAMALVWDDENLLAYQISIEISQSTAEIKQLPVS